MPPPIDFLATFPCPYPADAPVEAPALLLPAYVLPAPPVLAAYFEDGGATLFPPIM